VIVLVRRQRSIKEVQVDYENARSDAENLYERALELMSQGYKGVVTSAIEAGQKALRLSGELSSLKNKSDYLTQTTQEERIDLVNKVRRLILSRKYI
jgi:hypothetical protein